MNVDTSSIAVEIPVVVAVDGPAGSGKSSVSRAAAAKLGFGYLDTGAAYRALAWWALESGVDVADASQIISLLDGFDYRGGVLPTDRAVVVSDVDVTEAIRTERVSGAVSAVARVPEVRLHLNRLFGAIIAVSAPGIVVEGRDITTVVAPDAAVRVLLTADESVRMARRSAEAEGSSVTAEDAATLAAHVAARDAADSKVNNFLTAADGVHTLDSTHLNFEQTVDALVSLVTDARRP